MLSRRASNPNIRVYSTINFAPRRPADFVNFRGAGRGGAAPTFCGAGRGGAGCCPAGRGGAIIPGFSHKRYFFGVFSAILKHFHTLTLSHFHTFTLSHFHTSTFTLSLSHFHFHTLTLSHSHTFILSHFHTLTISHSHSFTLSHS